MKLIIQIPCYNEEATLPLTLEELPQAIPGVDTIEVLIVDDGSQDGTVDAARAGGVDHVVRFPQNRGLAAAFAAGLDASLRLGADIIVNTDGDRQYAGADIPSLIDPILTGRADIVIGDRGLGTNPYFSRSKSFLQRVGSWVVRQASDTDIPDTTSGFRAYSRDGALNLNVLSDYTYTLETIIQAGRKRVPLASVPVRTNPALRESRLMTSMVSYIRRSAATIVRFYTMYEPLRVFSMSGALLIIVGLVLLIRYTYYIRLGEGPGHVQSVVVGASALVLGFQTLFIGLLADLTSTNRKLSEELLYRVKRLELTLEREQRTPMDDTPADGSTMPRKDGPGG